MVFSDENFRVFLKWQFEILLKNTDLPALHNRRMLFFFFITKTGNMLHDRKAGSALQ